MKALITAGGRGTRLRPITNTLNKHLVPIGNKPLLFRAIENVRDIGITDVIININADDTELPTIVGDGSSWGIHITYIRQQEPKGLGNVLQLAEALIGSSPFVFYYGDNVLAGGLAPHLQKFNELQSSCHLCLVKVDNPAQFGVAVVEGNKVIKTVEKPADFVSDLAITGIQFYDASIFEAIKHIQPTPPKPPRTIAEMDIPPANQWLIDQGYAVTYSVITEWWKDTGRPSDLLSANRLLLDHLVSSNHAKSCEGSILNGNIEIGSGSVIENSEITGPVVIGENVVLRQARIGPYVAIGDRCQVENAAITDSIALPGGKIMAIPQTINHSILGSDIVIEGSQDEGSLELILGDHGQIKLPQ